MNAVLAQMLIRLYSQEWRARYEAEFFEFLTQTPSSLHMVLDVAVSGIRESTTRRFRRRADTFRGVVMAKRRSLAQISGMLLGIVAFSLVAEATPRWSPHRAADDFRVWPGDSRIRYELGTEESAASVAAALPVATSSVESTQDNIFFHRPFLIYICASEKNADAFRRLAGMDEVRGQRRIFISPNLVDCRKSILATLVAQMSALSTASSSSVGRSR